MSTLRQLVQGSSPTFDSSGRLAAMRHFAHLGTENTVASLAPFVESAELACWNAKAVREGLELLQRQPERSAELVCRHRAPLDHGLQALQRFKCTSDTIRRADTKDLKILEAFEDSVLPNYNIVAEHIYGPLSNLFACLTKPSRSKATSAPTLPGRPLHFLNSSKPALAAGFDSFLRNSIAHGAWSFVDEAILMQDTEQQESLNPADLLEKYLQLRMTVTSLLLALTIYSGEALRNNAALLPAIGKILLNGEAGFLWEISRAHENLGSQRELFIDARVNDPALESVSFASLQIAARAHDLFGMRHDWLYLSLDTGADSPAYAHVNGAALRKNYDEEITPTVWDEIVTFLPFGIPKKRAPRVVRYVHHLRRAIDHSDTIAGPKLRSLGFGFSDDIYDVFTGSCDYFEEGVALKAYVVIRPHIHATRHTVELACKAAMAKLKREKWRGYSLYYDPSRKPLSASSIRMFVCRRYEPVWRLIRSETSWSRNLLATAFWCKHPGRKYFYSWRRSKRISGFALTHFYTDRGLRELEESEWNEQRISAGSCRARLALETGHDAPVHSLLIRHYFLESQPDSAGVRNLLLVAADLAKTSEGFGWRDGPSKIEIVVGVDPTDMGDGTWGWLGKYTWSEKREEAAEVVVRTKDNLEAETIYLSKSLGRPIAANLDGSVAIEISQPRRCDMIDDRVSHIDAAIKQLWRTERFILVDNGERWGAVSRKQWRDADVSRSSSSALERLRRGARVSFDQLGKRLCGVGAQLDLK